MRCQEPQTLYHTNGKADTLAITVCNETSITVQKDKLQKGSIRVFYLNIDFQADMFLKHSQTPKTRERFGIKYEAQQPVPYCCYPQSSVPVSQSPKTNIKPIRKQKISCPPRKTRAQKTTQAQVQATQDGVGLRQTRTKPWLVLVGKNIKPIQHRTVRICTNHQQPQQQILLPLTSKLQLSSRSTLPQSIHRQTQFRNPEPTWSILSPKSSQVSSYFRRVKPFDNLSLKTTLSQSGISQLSSDIRVDESVILIKYFDDKMSTLSLGAP